jgi:arylamine N-acetyltransferase
VSALPDPYPRYLQILGIEAVPSGLNGLRDLVRQHLCRVPFENVSKLLLFQREGAGRPIRMDEFLDGIEHQDLGGTCYSSNPFLAQLLRALGYDATLIAADMSEPDVHTSVRVRLGSRQYHVDVGYAAPFYAPIPLDEMPISISSGVHRYVVDSAEAPGSCRVTMLVNGEARHGYVAHLPERPPEFFVPTIVRSFERHRTFMRVLRITRFFEGHTVELRNRTLWRHTPGGSDQLCLSSLSELRNAVNTEFRMPRCPVETAVGILEELAGRDLFGDAPWADAV